MIDEETCEEIGGTMEEIILQSNETACVLEPQNDMTVALYENYKDQETVSIGKKSNNPNYDQTVIREVASAEADFDDAISGNYNIKFNDIESLVITK